MESREGFPEMLKIVCSMIARPESLAFREPVDWKLLGLTDYLDVVKQPMDLGTIKKNIETCAYKAVDEIASDIRLVWSNCMLYNRDGSEYYHLADTFARAFEEAYSAFRRLEDSKADNGRIPTLEERMQLSHDIFKVENTEIARALTLIETNCPSALCRKTSVDEVLINIDALTPKCFHEVNAFILSCLINNGGSKKKKRASSSGAQAASSTSTSGTGATTSKGSKKSKQS